MADLTITDPDKYTVVLENERVRVLEYRDEPGAKTSPHYHPDSVMITLSGFDRRHRRRSGPRGHPRADRDPVAGRADPLGREHRENADTRDLRGTEERD